MSRALATLACAALVRVGGSTNAAAHEERQVGKYTLEVGWRDEPAIEGIMNAVEVEVHETASGKGVQGLSRTLRLLVSYGGLTQTFEPTLRPVGAEAGSYLGDFIPTASGDYTFRVVGTIEDLKVDERFESGPSRFDPVRPPDTLQFPERVGSAGALAREVRALNDQVQAWRLVTVGALGLALAAGVALMLIRGRR